jgi:hypothetical protein
MVGITPRLARNEKEALLIMYGPAWQKRFWPLDGQEGRPSIADCIDFALRKRNSRAQQDLVAFLESYLTDMARRCHYSASHE